MPKPIYILAAKRTPVGSFQGALSSISAPQLGAHAISAAMAQTGVDPSTVNEVLMGNVISAGLKQAPARQAMREAGLSDGCGATTINKVCGSGMKATMLAADLINAGSAETIIAGGMESMSNAPYLLAKARQGLRMGHTDMQDSMFFDGLEDAETGNAMGTFAQATADQHQLSREAMDLYAIESVNRARRATTEGHLTAEIEALEIKGATISEDEQPRRAKIDRIPTLRPAFTKDGTITAANSSSISDGASALLISTHPDLGSNAPLAHLVGHTTHSRHPSEFTIAPISAINNLLAQVGWQKEDVDVFEINEAFAMVTMLAISELKLDPAKVNIYGGACAQGHPIGSTGARLLVTLTHALLQTGGKRGIAALCIGGGEATAVAIER